MKDLCMSQGLQKYTKTILMIKLFSCLIQNKIQQQMEDQSVCSQSDVERDAMKGNSNSNVKIQQTASDDDWDEEKDIMTFTDDDDLEFLENLNHVNRLKIFDAVIKLPNFPGYQPKSSAESFSEIVTKAVGLKHVLNIKKKLPTKEVEEYEDLLTDVCVEMKCQEWIKKEQKMCC